MALDYHQTIEGTLTPLPDAILVYNLESTGERVQNGIIILDENAQGRGIHPRWAQVYAKGDNVTDVEVDDWILVDHGRWTRGINLVSEGQEEDDGVIVRMVDPNDIFGVSDEPPVSTGGTSEAFSMVKKSLY